LFTLGSDFWTRLSQKRREMDSEEEGQEEENVEISPGQMPSTTVMCGMRPSLVVRVLEHFAGWVEDMGGLGGDHERAGAWLYSLLARLEKPLHPDVGSAIRTLAHVCSRQRKELAAGQQEDVKALNTLSLIICLVAKYFGQADLSD